MDEKQLTTEETIRELMRNGSADNQREDRFVNLLLDLIAERSEEKAEERIDQHERDYDHNNWRSDF